MNGPLFNTSDFIKNNECDMNIFSALFKPVTNIVGTYVKDKGEIKKAEQKLKVAKLERSAELVKSASHKASDADLMMVKDKGWIQNLTLLVALAPIVMLFIPLTRPTAEAGLDAFFLYFDVPRWTYLAAVAVMLACIWGLRRIFILILNAKFNKLI